MNSSARSTAALLAHSGQQRVLSAGLGLFLVGGVLSWLAADLLQVSLGALSWPVAIVSAVLAALGLGIAVLCVRCPGCGLRWVPWAIGNQPHSQWLAWLLTFDSCPRCGHTSTVGRQEDGAT
jgi:hypothetical protein